MADMVTLIAFALGFIAASTTPAVAEWIKQKWFRPQLHLDHPPGERGRFTTLKESGKYAIYIRVIVENTGRSVATKCRAHLTEIKRQGPSGKCEIECLHDSIPLCWSFLPEKEPQLNDIPRNIKVNRDVAWSYEENNTLRPCSTVLSFSIQKAFSQVGFYRLTILVSADNCHDPKPFFLIIGWDGKWDQVQARAAE
jgi:hypothetical protein